MVLLTVLLLFSCAFDRAFSADWSYSGATGPSHWKEIDGTCGLNRQSPINIYQGDVLANRVSRDIVYTNYDRSNVMTLRNNGHTAVVDLNSTTPITISEGGLPGVFRAVQFHFHWGADSNTGSEHLLAGRMYPMELHIVHYNSNYSRLSDAVNKEDGVAVLGFMFEVSSSDNPKYNGIVQRLSDIRNPGSTVSIEPMSLNSFLPPSFSQFYRYSGSLTTPGCQESVTWTVFQEPIKLSERQLTGFRNLLDSHNSPLVNNYRPVQSLNYRTVTANFDPDIHWGYAGGEHTIEAEDWKNYYSGCGGNHQSPVNIPRRGSRLNYGIPALKFANYNTHQGAPMTLKNNGHTVQVDFLSTQASISGGNLPESYQLAQVHFHWGSSVGKGSEHTLDGHSYPMEIHIVHFRKSLSSLSRAVAEPNGLAVLAIFAQVSSSDNWALKPVVDCLTSVQSPGTNTPVLAFNLGSILPPTADFFRYSGSLTTPKCYQSVIWTVFDSTISISNSQLNAFRQLKSSEVDDEGRNIALVDNFRPIQNLNDRDVFRTFQIFSHVQAHWSYHGEHGPRDWLKEYPTCQDTPTSHQSPINIQPKKAEFKKIVPLLFSNYESVKGFTMQLKNNGHSAQVNIIGGDIQISGGGLDSTYKAISFHFHWGSNSTKGSEHLIDGNAYPMELHIVHYNMKYPELATAVPQSDGLAVLGFVYQITKEDNPAYNPIIEKLDDIKDPDTEVDIPSIPIISLLPENHNDFYRYQGSLTTPGCQESVTWTVFKNPIEISEKQLKEFRSLKSSEDDPNTHQPSLLVDNYRPTQNLNSRVVYSNFKTGDTTDGGESGLMTSSLSLLVSSLMAVALHKLVY